MKYRDRIIIVVIVAILVGAFILAIVNSSRTPIAPTVTNWNTLTTLSTSTSPGLDQSISDGTIKIAYSLIDFTLATTAAAVLIHAYIPPCGEGFLYCLYYDGTRYVGTNFESAGLSVKERMDLMNATSCLTTSPYGDASIMVPDLTGSTDMYSWSEFSKIDDAAAGHYANGSLYRLYVGSKSASTTAVFSGSESAAANVVKPKCYELATRIGQTQYANYPAGAKREFTARDQSDLQASLKEVIDNVSLISGNKNLFK